jgi:SAM-dependent methyltransferase
MELEDIGAIEPPVPWRGIGKIPWHEAAFSRRMLREHLSQEHGRASRRFGTIDQHVAWIHEHVLGGTAGRVLDLGCGPGFYTERLARRGHSCVGIDFSPASVAHAQAEAERAALPCEYRLEDLKVADFGSGFDLVLLVFGELNAFAPSEAGAILAKARRSLAPSGSLLLEAHSEEHVRSLGARAPTWFRAQRGLFSDEPHLCLTECAWHPDFRASTEQYFVVSLPSSEVSHYVSTSQAYADREYLELLHGAGFPQVDRHASLTGERVDGEDGLFVWIARA